jgi:L-threonylcarbamoyladenylate synthase
MKLLSQLDDPRLISGLKNGQVAVLKTDTLYGLVASVDNPAAVEKVYRLKGRNPDKACIILIADTSQILPGTQWSEAYEELAAKYWPGPVSLVVPVGEDVPAYIHRRETSLAYRMPAPGPLRKLLQATGPLIAPSANPESLPPAQNIDEAEEYFGEGVPLYVDTGMCEQSEPSRIITLDEQAREVRLR